MLQRLRTVLLCLLALPLVASAQSYTSIVVFGDSLSDTGNVSNLTAAKYAGLATLPGPTYDYTYGRFTDGLNDTSPAARLYSGVWVEQLAALLAAHPTVKDSLDGGTDYAYGFATTGAGTSVLTYPPSLSVNVNNLSTQVASYLATSPVITSKTLFVVWAGANDLINASSSADIVAAATRDVATVQALITAGATDIIIPNLPPLGAVPRFNGSPSTSLPATAASQAFDQAIAAGLATLPAANPGKTLHLFPLDVYTLFNTILASPSSFTVAGSTYSFANVTASSQLNTAVNPDTYLFWDDLHPTTAGHHLIALSALALITPVTTSTTVTASPVSANLGASVTLTATVTSGTIPAGTVTFYDGSTALSTVQLGATSPYTATYTTTALATGTHSITASFTPTSISSPSTSAPFTITVVAPGISASASPAYFTIQTGAGATSTISVSSVGGFAGSVSLACNSSNIPYSTCTLSSSSLTFTGTNSTQTSTLTFATGKSTALLAPALHPFRNLPGQGIALCLLLPFFGLLTLGRTRARLRSSGMLAVLLTAGSLALLAVTGCGSNSPPKTPTGTYNLAVTYTSTAGTGTLTLPITITP